MTSYKRVFSFCLFFLGIWTVSSAFSEVENKEGITDELLSHLWVDNTVEKVSEQELLGFSGIIVDSKGLKTLSPVAKQKLIVALNFDPQLDISDLDLPSASTLSALNNEVLINEFAQSYVNLCRKEGVDFLVFPEATEALEYAKFLNHILAIDSSLVIRNTIFQIPDEKAGKKEIREYLSQDKILVLEPKGWDRMNKNLKKLKKEKFQLSFYKKFQGEFEEPDFNTKLLISIFQHSATFFSSSQPSLPNNQNEIAFLAPSQSSHLRSELEKYFEVTDVNLEAPKKNQAILVDARTDGLALEYFLQNYSDHHKIALVSNESPHLIEADEYIYFPENHPIHDILIPQMLYGALAIDGVSKHLLKSNELLKNFEIPSAGKLRYAPPEWEGVNSKKLNAIDDLVKELIDIQASPGCQITIIKGSTVVFDRSYGHLTYDSLIEVKNSTLYDIASVTKVSATLLAIMHLYDRGEIGLEDSISQYLTEYSGTNKSSITIKQLLSHQGGLRPYEPLWKRALKGDFLEPFSYYRDGDEEQDIRSYGIPIHPIMRDSIQSWLKNSPLLKDTDRYKYSDLGFMVLQQLVERITEMSIEQYLNEHFYQPLGLHYTAFNPLDKGYEIYKIAPTEFDHAYRKELIWGSVHDRNAAIFGGVAGHAGLFSSAKELAIIMKMILNEGSYAGREFVSASTINEFNQSYFTGNRRALGWDKYDDSVENASPYVSDSSFGHTGFTGTMLWVDPEYDLIYSFVSNRIYPDSRNRKLQRHDFRNRIQSAIYEAFLGEARVDGTIPSDRR